MKCPIYFIFCNTLVKFRKVAFYGPVGENIVFSGLFAGLVEKLNGLCNDLQGMCVALLLVWKNVRKFLSLTSSVNLL